MPIAAAAIPANKGLNIAGAAIGVAQMAAMVATAAIDAGLYFTKKIPLSMTKMLMNRSDIALEDLNFQMFKTKIPVGKLSSVARVNLKPLLKGHLLESDDSLLSILSLSDLMRAWSTLKSGNNDLIACDTACVLAAMQIRKEILNLKFFQDFLDAKYAFMESVAQTSMFSVSGMEKAIPDKYVNSYLYLHHFNMLLNQIPTEYYDYTKCRGILLKEILGISSVGIIFVPGHAQVVMRYFNCWATYEFTNDNVTVVRGPLVRIENLLFSHIDCPFEKKILGCKAIAFPKLIPINLS